MKGQFALKLNVKPINEPPAEIRSRNHYQPKRNKHLLIRYYYHSEIQRYRYDDCIKLLSDEFYLCERRIIDLLTNNVKELKQLAASEPSLNELQRHAPHFIFKVR